MSFFNIIILLPVFCCRCLSIRRVKSRGIGLFGSFAGFYFSPKLHKTIENKSMENPVEIMEFPAVAPNRFLQYFQ